MQVSWKALEASNRLLKFLEAKEDFKRFYECMMMTSSLHLMMNLKMSIRYLPSIKTQECIEQFVLHKRFNQL